MGGLASGSRNDRGASADVDHEKSLCPALEKNFKIYADSVTRMQENVMEYVSNISVIKAFGKEETKTEKTIQSAKDYDYWVKKSMAGISVPRD